MPFAPTIASFLPPALRLAAPDSPRAHADGERFSAAVLFADVSGFTRLAEQAAAAGNDGAATVSEKLRDVFGAVIDRATAHGGHVLRFAGDAAIVVWPGEGDALADAAHRAAACALELASVFPAESDGREASLAMHMGLGVGRLRAVHAGGVEDRWEYLVGGPALSQACAAEGVARRGEVVLSPACADLLVTRATLDWRGDHALLTGIRAVERSSATLPGHDMVVGDEALAYVSRVVRARLDAVHARWLAELRRVTVLFVSLASFDFDRDDADGLARRAVRAMQEAVYRRHGSINQLVVDDKGTVLVAAWGLPSRTHEDDPTRALDAALELVETLGALGLRASAGVATGRVFCGERGNAIRCEYGLIGHRVNLAARLMQRADGAVLCDGATAAATRGAVHLDGPRKVPLRDGAEPVEVWRATRAAPLEAPARQMHPLVGREAEQTTVARTLERFADGVGAGHLCIAGEAGIGKSRLVALATEVAAGAGLRVFHGACEATRTAAYGAWSQVFAALLGVDGARDATTRAAALRSALGAIDPSLVELAPLVAPVVSLDLGATARTQEMTGQVRADNTRALLVRVLQHATATHRAAVVLDDVHWMDSASWSLCVAVRVQCPRVAMVMALRRSELRDPTAQTLLAGDGLTVLTLGALDGDHAVRVACEALGVDALPPAVSALLLSRAGGNPFFIEELAFALRDAGALAHSPEALKALAIPDTVEGVVATRVDRLSPDEQLTLKAASVIGQHFSRALLHEVHPDGADEAAIARALTHLHAVDLVRDVGDGECAFRHAVTREVVYGLLLPSQRRALHESVARAMERSLGAEVALHLAELAHHWRQAGDDPRALAYLERAGVRATEQGMYREGIRLLDEAVALDAALVVRGHGASTDRRVRWARHLGDAWFALGDMVRSRQHLERALSLAGIAVPDRPDGWNRAAVDQLGAQLLHLVRAPRTGSLRPDEQRTLAECAFAAGALSEQRYYEADTGGWLATTLLAVNLAERADRLDAAGRGYGGLGYLAGVARAAPLARRWLRLGQRHGDARARGMAWGAEGLYHTCFGRWHEAMACYREGELQLRRLGDRFALANSLYMRGCQHAWLGDFDRAIATGEELLELVLAAGNTQQALWAVNELAPLYAHRGRLDDAAALLDRTSDFIAQTDALSRSRHPAVRALVLHRRGDVTGARQAVAPAVAWFAKNPASAFGDYGAVLAMVEVCADAPQDLDVAVRSATAMARVFPPLAGFGRWAEGERAWRRGDVREARVCWRRAADDGRRAGAMLFEALAWFALATRGAPDDREAHAEAERTLRRMGADWYLAQLPSPKG